MLYFETWSILVLIGLSSDYSELIFHALLGCSFGVGFYLFIYLFFVKHVSSYGFFFSEQAEIG